MTVTSQKSQKRDEMRAWLRGVSLGFRDQASRAIQDLVEGLPVFQDAETVMVYAAMRTEPCLNALVDVALKMGKTVVFPRVAGVQMEIRRVTHRDQLKPGSYGILEPSMKQCPLVSVAGIDLVLTPGVAFGAAGERLGQGGGFYDRFFSHSEFNGFIVGICFDNQRVEHLPVMDHDVLMNAIVSEGGVVIPGTFSKDSGAEKTG